MTLWILLGAAVATSLLLGLLAKMGVKELAAQTLAMVGSALAFYGLVGLL